MILKVRYWCLLVERSQLILYVLYIIKINIITFGGEYADEYEKALWSWGHRSHI